MAKKIQNLEQREAEQDKVNRERDAFIESLPDDEKAKFKAVEKAVRILIKAEVPFYLFPRLDSLQFKGKKQIWQWNSLAALMKYDSNDKLTAESAKSNGEFHEAFFSFLFNQFRYLFKGETTEEKLTALPFFFHYCFTKFNDYIEEENKEKNES